METSGAASSMTAARAGSREVTRGKVTQHLGSEAQIR